MATSRRNFDNDADAPQRDGGPQRLTYPCKARGCPMPGTIFLGGPDGICSWHYGANGSDFARITEVLTNWRPVVRAINGARQIACNPNTCSDGKAQREWMAGVWAELAQEFAGSGWKQRLAPAADEDFASWGYRLSKFMNARLRSDLFHIERDDDGDTPVQAEMRKGLRPGMGGSLPIDGWNGP